MIAALGLVITAAAAAVGLILEAPGGLSIILVAVAVGGLLAWDLTDFSRRLRLAATSDDLSAIRRHHLVSLGLTVGAGLLLTCATMLIPLHFSFAWTVFLALMAILAMAQLASRHFRG